MKTIGVRVVRDGLGAWGVWPEQSYPFVSGCMGWIP